MNTVAGGSIANMMGAPGAWIADFLLWLFGVPGALVLPLMLVLSRRMWGGYAMGGWQGQLGRCLLGIYLIGLALYIRSEEHTSEIQSLRRITYAVFCWKKKKINKKNT